MSQRTFSGFPSFSGSIQYSPFPFESSASTMCLHEIAGLDENQPRISKFKIKHFFQEKTFLAEHLTNRYDDVEYYPNHDYQSKTRIIAMSVSLEFDYMMNFNPLTSKFAKSRKLVD